MRLWSLSKEGGGGEIVGQEEVEAPDIIKINTGHLWVVRPDRDSNLMIESEFVAKINYFSIFVVDVELLIQLFVDIVLFIQYITHSNVLLYYIVPGMCFPGLSHSIRDQSMLNFKTFSFSVYFRLYLVSPKENDNLELINYLGLKVWSSTDISSPTGPSLNFIHFNDLEKRITLTGENIFPARSNQTGTFTYWLQVGYHHHHR